jgi:hypothetical protein
MRRQRRRDGQLAAEFGSRVGAANLRVHDRLLGY